MGTGGSALGYDEPSRSLAARMKLLGHPRTRRVLSIVLTLGAFGYLASIVDFEKLTEAMAKVPLSAWLAGVLLTSASLGGGWVRWWLMFRAFGAQRPPTLAGLWRRYMAGLFYNTFLPGGVSGDVVRGLATQSAFPPGSAGGLATVVVERALGLAALLTVTATALIAHPLPGMSHARWPAVLASVLCFLGILALANARELVRYAPRVLVSVIERLPAPRAWKPLWLALALSFNNQLAPALCGHVIVLSLAPHVTLADSLLIVPLATAAAFLPISVGGAGVRETIFVALYARVGVSAQDAFATSLCMWAIQCGLAAVGGVSVLFGRALTAPAARLPQV